MEDREESEALVSPCLVWESKVESISRYLRPIQRKRNGLEVLTGPQEGGKQHPPKAQ